MNEKADRGIEYFNRAVSAPDRTTNDCLVCGEQLDELAAYEICRTCGWQDDPVQNADPMFCGGANQMSLTQARAYWKETHKRVICGNGSPEMNEIQQLAISLIEKHQ